MSESCFVWKPLFVSIVLSNSCVCGIRVTASETRCGTWYARCKTWSSWGSPAAANPTSARTQWHERAIGERYSGNTWPVFGSPSPVMAAPTTRLAVWRVHWRKNRTRKMQSVICLRVRRVVKRAWTLIQDIPRHLGRMRAWFCGAQGMCVFHLLPASALTAFGPNRPRMHAWNAGPHLKPVNLRTGPRPCWQEAATGNLSCWETTALQTSLKTGWTFLSVLKWQI